MATLKVVEQTRLLSARAANTEVTDVSDKFADLHEWAEELSARGYRGQPVCAGPAYPKIFREVFDHIGAGTVLSRVFRTGGQGGHALSEREFLEGLWSGKLPVLPWRLEARPRTVGAVSRACFERAIASGWQTVRVRVQVTPLEDWNEHVFLYYATDPFGDGTWFGFVVDSTESMLLRWGAGRTRR